MILRPPAGTSSSELLWDAEVRRARRFARIPASTCVCPPASIRGSTCLATGPPNETGSSFPLTLCITFAALLRLGVTTDSTASLVRCCASWCTRCLSGATRVQPT